MAKKKPATKQAYVVTPIAQEKAAPLKVTLQIKTVRVFEGGTFTVPIKTTTPGDGSRYIPESHNRPIPQPKSKRKGR